MRKWFAIIGTLLIVAAGYFLPQIVVKTLDKPSEYVYDLNIVSLENVKKEPSIINALCGVGDFYDNKEINPSSAQLTLNDAKKEADYIVNQLVSRGIINIKTPVTALSYTCNLRISSYKDIDYDVDYSSINLDDIVMIVWEFYYDFYDNACQITIDDSTAKMISFRWGNNFNNAWRPPQNANSIDPILEIVDNQGELLTGAEKKIAELSDFINRYYNLSVECYTADNMWHYSLKNSKGDIANVRVFISSEDILFN